MTRNFRCRFGELDLVMRDGGALVVVEVRQRAATDPIGALASVAAAKQRRLVLATEVLLRARPTLADAPIRFDVVAITGSARDGALDWVPDAFRP